MTNAAKKASSYPFYVRIKDGSSDTDINALKGHESAASVKTDADDRTAQAKKLGLPTQYEVVTNEEA